MSLTDKIADLEKQVEFWKQALSSERTRHEIAKGKAVQAAYENIAKHFEKSETVLHQNIANVVRDLAKESQASGKGEEE